MKYIFLAGAPGSKWSSVAKHLYDSSEIDISDQRKDRQYWHSAWGEPKLMHMGAYWDPGMEFGDRFDQLSTYSRSECEAKFDEPFSGRGIRVIKSHVFCHHLNFIRHTWPDCPIVLVDRDDDACLGWWVRCGHFGITYPVYDHYYRDLPHMAREIDKQNADLRYFVHKIKATRLKDSNQLKRRLGIRVTNPKQDYDDDDIRLWYVMPSISI
jgi:hypothetical protein